MEFGRSHWARSLVPDNVWVCTVCNVFLLMFKVSNVNFSSANISLVGSNVMNT